MKRPKKTTIASKPAPARKGGTPSRKGGSPSPGGGLPAYTLNLPILLALFVFFTVFGGGITYLATRIASPTPTAESGGLVIFTDTPAVDTPQPTNTLIPTTTNTPIPVPTLTPIPYTIQSGDTCQAIAGAFNISTQALITSNGLSVNCYLVEGQVLQVPQPTPLPTTDAIATQSARQTEAACPVEYVTVQSGDTIEIIAQYTRVPVADILAYNGKTSSLLFAGEVLAIPTCKVATDLTGATYTPSPAPTYQAPQPIQPSRGSYFRTGDEIVLQWAAPAELRENEYYLLTITDTTAGGTPVLEEQIKDSTFIIPASYQPDADTPHIYSWKISVVALIGQDADGVPIYRTSSIDSPALYFAWEGK